MIRFEEGDDHIIQDETHLPFKLIGNLGHGHSGNVEEVENLITGALFARKTIKIRAQRTRAATENIFKNEVKIIRGLSKHHHIIHVFATYMAKREVGLILQPVADEGDLSRFLDHVGDIRLADAEDVRLYRLLGVLDRAFGCLASGLAFMHRQRIRHKDIKPQNILIHQESVIFTDFGYSWDSSNLSRSTTEGQPDSLTRRYSAPEVLECRERNSSSDVFSLGCVYLELLAVKYDELAFVPQSELFSADLAEIHHRLQSTEHNLHPPMFPSIIVSMTAHETKSRSKASHVVDFLENHPAYLCDACRAFERPPALVPPVYIQASQVVTPTIRSDVSTLTTSTVEQIIPSAKTVIDEDDRLIGSEKSPHGRSRPEWNVQRQSYVRYKWSIQYRRALREIYDQDSGWKFLDWDTGDWQRGLLELDAKDRQELPRSTNIESVDQDQPAYAPSRVQDRASFTEGVVLSAVDQQHLPKSQLLGITPLHLIVVKLSSHYCQAVPVFLQHHFNQHVLSPGQYAYVYLDGGYFRHSSEKVGLLDQPICIQQTDATMVLHPQARIWFRMNFQIPYDTILKRAGRVHPLWLQTFLSYWEMNQAPQPMQEEQGMDETAPHRGNLYSYDNESSSANKVEESFEPIIAPVRYEGDDTGYHQGSAESATTEKSVQWIRKAKDTRAESHLRPFFIGANGSTPSVTKAAVTSPGHRTPQSPPPPFFRWAAGPSKKKK